MNKTIICEIGPDDQYPWAMYVVASGHPRFVVGSRFDFGFMKIALNEGYTVIVGPVPDDLRERDRDGRLVWSGRGDLVRR